MGTQQEWYDRWAKRLVEDMREEINYHEQRISQLKELLASAASDQEGDDITLEITRHHKSIDFVRRDHAYYQLISPRRWNTKVAAL